MEYLEIVKSIVVEAGNIALNHFHHLKNVKIQEKNVGDFVSNADLECESFMKTELNKKFPGFSFLTEEAGVDDKDSDYKWIIDPIDGTSNFLKGSPYFACCLCLRQKNETILSVIYFPALDELYYASKDADGAFLAFPQSKKKTIKLHCSESEKIFGGLIGYGFGNYNFERMSYIVKSLRPLACSIRTLGVSSGDILQVARGTYGAYIKSNIKDWDLYPAAFIAEKAGAKLYDVYGTEISLIENYSAEKFGVIVTPPTYMSEMKPLLKSEEKDNDRFVFTSTPYVHQYKPYWDKTKEVAKKIYHKSLPIIKLIWEYIKIGYSKAKPYVIKYSLWIKKEAIILYKKVLEKIKK